MNAPPSDLDAVAMARFGGLRPAERLLLRSFRAGEIARVGLRLPETSFEEISIRASLIAHLLRGGLRHRGRPLQLVGACIEGRLDLGEATVRGSLWFYRCRFDAPVLLDGARVTGAVSFAGCHLPGLLAEACSIGGDLVLNAGCTVDDGVRLSRAQIGGRLDASRLDLSGSKEPAAGRRALLADGLRVGGDVLLGEGFRAIGEVRFSAARVGGDFRAGGLFNGNPMPEGGRGAALIMDRIEVEGSVRFDGGFGAAGCVRMSRARIGDDLDATGASFDWLGDAGWADSASLVLDRSRIEGTLILRQLRTPLQGASFVGARVGTLADDETTWGDRLALDGFTYSRLGDGAPLDTVFRVDWLERQQPAHLRAQFRTQPWRRLIRVLRRMGHEHRAGSIALRREQWLRRVGRIGAWAPPGLRWLPQAGHLLLGLLAGHGYRPGRLVGWLGAVWLLCGGCYWIAAHLGAPEGSDLDADAAFSPFAYSFDRLLPLADLSKPGAWLGASAWPQTVHLLGQLEAGFGWLAALLLLASLAGWQDRDRGR
jgi:hypothetical protein